METSSDSTTDPLETTKDTCNLGVKQTSEETGMVSMFYSTFHYLVCYMQSTNQWITFSHNCFIQRRN